MLWGKKKAELVVRGHLNLNLQRISLCYFGKKLSCLSAVAFQDVQK